MEAIIGIGSNVGDREGSILRAFAAIEARLGPGKLSALYETRPLLHPDAPTPGQGPFLNAAACVETSIEPVPLLAALLDIESEAGRKRSGLQHPWQPRVLDLDLLAYESLVIVGDGLVLPHPRMHQRDFVLLPLRDVAPGWRHPVTGASVDELLPSAAHTILRRRHEDRKSPSIPGL